MKTQKENKHFVEDNHHSRSPLIRIVDLNAQRSVSNLLCPDCGARLIPSSGCSFCPCCGWSRCS